ncbi:MAG: S41 family peptidase [Acidobacteriota bacterium]
MNSRGRVAVLVLSLPVAMYAVVGGVMGNAMARQESYQFLRIFEDVVTLIVNNYVEEVQVDKVMRGAMHGLADGLDPDSAYLTADQVKAFESKAPSPTGQVGLELTRQYYLRVIAARDNSPGAKAGLQPGDYVRAIDGQSTRDTSVHEGMNLLAGKPGTKVELTVLRGNAAEPHQLTLTRENLAPVTVRGRILEPGIGYVRIPAFGKTSASELRSQMAALTKSGAARAVIDVRGTAFGEVDAGLEAARLFVKSGTLIYRQERGKPKEPIQAADGDGQLTLPIAILSDAGTAGPGEVFAAALTGNGRGLLVGERTLGRAARQRLIRLPDGSGLMLTHLLYVTATDVVINERGLTPEVAVEQPEVEFGQPLPAGDSTLEQAVKQLKSR